MKKPKSLRPLSDKQEQFVAYVRQGVSLGSASYKVWKDVGYGKEQRWRRNEQIMEAVQQAQADLIEQSKITRQDVVDGFMQAINHAVLQGDASGQIKGWTELARMHGYYEPEKKIIEHKMVMEQRHFEEMSDQELLEHAASAPITLADTEFKMIEVEIGQRKTG